MASSETVDPIELFRVRKLIRSLSDVRGQGTSMISIIINPRDEISTIQNLLKTEYGTATHIKSRVNRLSVLSAIQSAQAKLKLYNRVPPHGLVVYVGTASMDGRRTKKISLAFEPFKAINTSMYRCGNQFYTEPLEELLECNDRYGFIIMDGNGTLFGLLQGNTRTVIGKFSVELPKKHGRGGQSAVRFSRLREEARHNYVRKVTEMAASYFLADERPNVNGLVLAGSADFKTVLSNSDMFDPRLRGVIVDIVDIAAGGETGFTQAIEKSADQLASVKFVQEKRLLQSYFEEIAKDSGLFIFGIRETMFALEAGAVDTLIVYEDLPHLRVVCRTPDDEERIVYLTAEEMTDERKMTTRHGVKLEEVESEPLVDWLIVNHRELPAKLEFVSQMSSEGAQFVRGFGGIGGILRFSADQLGLEYIDSDFGEDDFDDDFDDDFF